MYLKETWIGKWKVVRPADSRLDAYVAEGLKESLIASVEDGTSRLVIDLSHVDFMDSSGLGAIVCCFHRMENGRIVLAGAHDAVELLLRVTRIDRVFTVVEHVADVLALEVPAP